MCHPLLLQAEINEGGSRRRRRRTKMKVGVRKKDESKQRELTGSHAIGESNLIYTSVKCTDGR